MVQPPLQPGSVVHHWKCLNGGKGCLHSSVLQQTEILLLIIQFESSFLGKAVLRGGIVKPKISHFQNPRKPTGLLIYILCSKYKSLP